MTYDFNKIKNLIITEEAREGWALPLTVLLSKITYKLGGNANLNEIQNKILTKIQEYKFGYRPGRFREGFLKVKNEENRIDGIFCKEIPLRFDFVPEDADEIENLRFKSINPRFKVKVIIILRDGEVEIRLFGGEETLAFSIRELIQTIIRGCLYNFTTINIEFSREQMLEIFEKFGVNVEYINIDPRDNSNFRKAIQKIPPDNREIREVLLYEVQTLKMKGYKIQGSPAVRQLLMEAKIYIKEILGKMHLGGKTNITTKVYSSGRVLFYIPNTVVNLYGDEVFEFSVDLFERLINVSSRISGQRTLSEDWTKDE